MSRHVIEDDLILHFYGETANEAPRIAAHLVECEECRDTWTSLRYTLTLVDGAEAPDVPEGFERVMWARLRPSLPASQEARPGWWSPGVWAPIVGLAAVIAVAFVGGRLWPRAIPSAAPAVPAVSDAAAARATRERVLLSALGDHFEQTEMLLVEIKNSSDVAQVNLAFERQAARDLVAAGRLYRETAAQDGDTQLTAVLEDLERVLVDVAGSPTDMSAQDLSSLRARIEDDSLLFKVRALTAAVREREKSLATRSTRTL